MKSTFQTKTETNSQHPWSLQNSKLLKIELSGNEIYARQGSMVAYQGQINFDNPGSGGLGKFLKKAVTGEGVPLMRATGSGDLFLADYASEVHLIFLENEKMIANGKNVLAFDAGLSHDIERVQGAGMLSGGLFNMTLQGTGWVAVVTEGTPLMLNPSEAPTYVDAQAAVCWSGDSTTSIKVDTGGLKSMIRGGSGESVQLAFGSGGWVLVQPSEGMQNLLAAQNGSSSSSSGGFLNNLG